MTVHLSLQQARHLQLAAQGLLAAPRRKADKAAALAAIRRMALLQIDTISVVARSPYLVLFSRIGHYDPAWLEQLLAEGALFEYWAHEACFVPTEDYGLMRHRMKNAEAMGWKFSQRWYDQHRADIEAIVEHIREHGPARSADFERKDGKGGGWWDWKPEKRHLEALFTLGRLMVKERRGFQRVYDLAERVLPDWDDARDLASPEQVRQAQVRNSCRALGLVKPAWVADYYRLKRAPYTELLHGLADAGELLPVKVEGWSHDAFVHASLQAELEQARDERLKSGNTVFLSPFDPLVWDRKRALELFDFDYKIECYTPAPKRQYGYFTLPLLNRGKLIGRMDAKAHRAQGVFEVKALHLEPGVRASQRLADDIGAALGRLARWHGTPRLAIAQAPAGLAEKLRG
ncbi:winged helix-turn-helix domain-containing protein [Chromobacterium sp. IIBBL 290-4]|uniref:winged helix-turn-helix domain-containing protein n=1 Tax=Chromobacterium sp. IIBBL 290-4 TaxID=2953890 RepID=UPI0020B693C9|nr:winged helix-turn-helix domain-containing protein [Chromobacterium sp. IIBBL 290-4]UTH75917.1 winged helix-turn-helix domain-containing protein [Chromobacterium sp. IIBBL 290-4]